MTGQASTHQVLRRKARRASEPEKGKGRAALTPDRAMARALARAAQRELDLQIDARDITVHEDLSLAELLDMPGERALLVILEGPGGGLGLFAVGPEVLEAILQKQTTGAVQPESDPARHPTRTDAAMAAGLIERTLGEFEVAMAGRAEPPWWAGYRYASYLAEPRSLGLLLEDTGYRALSFEADVAAGLRRGRMLLVLPLQAAAAPRRGSQGALDSPGVAAPAPPEEAADLSELVMQSGARFDAVLCRLNLPLGAVMRFKVGDVVELVGAHLDGVALDAPGARALAGGRLGQSRGRRAVRLYLPGESGGVVQPTEAQAEISQASEPQPVPEPALAPVADGAPEAPSDAAPLAGLAPLEAPMESGALTQE